MKPDPRSDGELLVRTREGDVDAFRVLFQRKYRRVYRIAYQILGDAGQAEEVVQEAFLALWQHSGRYRPRFRLDPWLSRIAANRAIDRWRSLRQERRRRVEPRRQAGGSSPGGPGGEWEGEGSSGLGRGSPAAGDPSAPAAWAELQAIWDELAELLSPQQRAAFVLREIEGLATRQVARALECSPSTVRSHIAAARRTLQRALAERYPEYLP